MSDPILFQPLTLRGVTSRNRIVLAPMCQYQAVDGRVQDWHFAHHARLALAGLGIAILEATAVVPEGRITHGCTGLWDDGHVPGLARIAELYRQNGVVPAIQIGHAGRKASAQRPWEGAQPLAVAGGPDKAWPTVGPSPLPEADGKPVPHALTPSEIGGIVEAFRAASRRALAAGFQAIEIHGAHGYLIHSFFSPLSNRREDAYGGSLRARMKLPLEVAQAVRSVWPDDLPVLYRTSAVDGIDGGLTIADTIALAKALKAEGVDVIDCSSGGIAGPATAATGKIKPGYQVPHAEAVRTKAGIKTIAVGAILDPHQAETILADGRADLIALGRELLADAGWPMRAARELGLANPYAMLPKYYSFYLERRAKVLDLS